MWALLQREWLRFVRQPARIVAVLALPLVFFGVIGAGFGSSFRTNDGASYSDFVLPGAGLLGVLFSAIFSTLSVIEDRESGFLQAVMVAPYGRRHFVLAKLTSGVVFAVAQATFVWLAAGIPLARLPLLTVATAVVSAFLVGLGFVVAWRTESVASYHSAMNSLFMPMWALSGSLFPIESAALWLRPWLMFNPLTPLLQFVRDAMAGRGTSVLTMVISFSLAAVFIALSVASAQRDARPRVTA